MHQPFALRVQGAGGLVQQQQDRVPQQGAGDGQALTLAAGEAHPALAEEGVETPRQPVQELTGMGGVRGAPHRRLRHPVQAVADVLPGIGAEDHRVLGDQGDVATKLRGVQVAQVDAVEAQGPDLGVVKAQQELQQGALTAPRGADQSDLFSRPDLEAQVLDHRQLGVGGIGETQPRDLDRPPGRAGQGLGNGRGTDGALGGQQFHQALAGPGPAQQFPGDLAQTADGTGHQDGIEEEGGEFPAAQAPRQDLPPAHPQHDADGAEGQGGGDGPQAGAESGAAHGGGEGRLHPFPIAGPVDGLVAEGLDGADGVEDLVDEGPHVSDPILAGAGQASQPVAEQPQGQHHQGGAEEHQPGEPGAGEGEHDEAAADQQQGAQGHGQGRADHGLQQGGVRGQAGDELAGAGGLEEAHVQPQHPGEDRHADVGDHPFADPAQQPGARQDGRRHGQHHRQEEQQGAVEGVCGTGLEPGVHHLADHLAKGEHGTRGYQQGQDREHHLCQVGADEA